MIARLARRASVSCGLPFEDAYQDATVVFLEAIHRFDPTREASFTTFAWSQIWGHLANLSRDERRDSELFEPLVGDVVEREIKTDGRNSVAVNLSDLPERLVEPLCLLYGIGCAAMNPREVARRMGQSAEWVEACEREALDLLRRSERKVA